jgi:hypothetical protein
MEQDSSWKVYSFSDGQELAYISWNPKVLYPARFQAFAAK